MGDFFNISDNGDHGNITGIVVENGIIYAMPYILGFLTPLAIYALYSLVKNGEATSVLIINLLVSDLIQIFCIIELIWRNLQWHIFDLIHSYCLVASVCFMVCVAIERYLIIAWPLWYRFRYTIKSTVVVCVVVWTLPLVSFIIGFRTVLFLPLPLLIVFLVGTIKALCASRVPSHDKQRIVVTLVLVLIIYTLLLFLPGILMVFSLTRTLSILNRICLTLNPFANLFLYVFMRKGAMAKPLECCCRRNSNNTSRETA